MVKFAEYYPDKTILHALCGKLNWSHFRLPKGSHGRYDDNDFTVHPEHVHMLLGLFDNKRYIAS
jgi:hypothetical protein